MPKRKDLDLTFVLDRAIRIQRRHIRELIHDKDKPEQLDSAQRTLASLVKEARSLAKDATQWGGNLTHEERQAVVVDWFGSLPLQQQQVFLQALIRAHNGERAAV